MTKSILAFVLVTTTLVLLSVAAFATPSLLGPTGGIFTPDDRVIGQDNFSANFDQVDFDHKTTLMGATIGLTPDLEIGISRFQSDDEGLKAQAMFNGKYVLLEEKPSTPSVAIGVVDATGNVSINGDASAYLVLGKNLTPAITDLAGQPVAPIHGYIGVGTGMINGLFLGASYQFSPKAELVVEYLSKLQFRNTYDEENVINAGLRLKLFDQLHAQVSAINLQDFGYGLSYSHSWK